MILPSTLSLLLLTVIFAAKALDWHDGDPNWAMGCDFKGNDLSNVRTTGANCGPTCVRTSGCTHFSWSNYNGGTCWLKSGSVSRNNAFGADGSMVCGLRPSSSSPKPPPPPPPSSSGSSCAKKGVAYSFTNTADLNALSSVSWYYNWNYRDTVGGSHRGEYVPMIWGADSLSPGANAIAAAIPAGAKYLLGFNEPNFYAQSNLSPQRAASLWPQVEAVANARGLKLGSPALNYCGPASSCWNTDPFQWMDQFLSACRGCRIDFIATHWYNCDLPSLQSYMGRWMNYGKPVWLTEWSCGQWAGGVHSPQQQAQYMKDAVAWMDSQSKIARYAWFSGRTTEVTNANLLAGTGQLTNPLGTTYNARTCGPAGAQENTVLTEETSTTPSIGVPGWAVGLIVIASIAMVLLVALLVLSRFRSGPEERV